MLALAQQHHHSSYAGKSLSQYIEELRRPGYLGALFRGTVLLEELLGHPVDLVTDKALRPELRPHVEREAVRV
jgi:predicted nucleotidyltransferase